MPWPATRSTSPRRGSFRRSSSSNRSCRSSSGRPRRGPAPTSTCWRSWPRGIPCRRRSSNIGNTPSSRGLTSTPCPQMVNPRTGRVHASFNQVVTATGRLSSHDPNLQNIPVRTEAGRAIRSAFVPGEEGWTLVAADYSQIELRILAHYTADQRLCEAFSATRTFTPAWPARSTTCPWKQVTEDMRRQAKVVNFGTIYGQGAVGLSRQLGIARQTASKFINSYFQTYPRHRAVPDPVARRVPQARLRDDDPRPPLCDRGRAGRRRPSRNLAERTAVNTIIQGSAADLMKLAMIAVYRRLQRQAQSPDAAADPRRVDL